MTPVTWASLVAQTVKESAHNVGYLDLIPGEGNGNPLQYSCLENSMDRETQWATVHGVPKSQTQLSNQHFVTVQKAPGKHEILTCDAGVTSNGIFFLACTVQSGTKSDKVSFHKCSGRLSLPSPGPPLWSGPLPRTNSTPPPSSPFTFPG